MDILSAIVIAALLAMMLCWAALAYYWRTQATEHSHVALGMACGLSRASQESYEAGLSEGLRQGTGGMYLAAVRVDADEGILEALRAAGRKLLGEPIEAPVGKVLEEV